MQKMQNSQKDAKMECGFRKGTFGVAKKQEGSKNYMT